MAVSAHLWSEPMQVDPELVQLVGEERLRKYLAAHLRHLKGLAATGGKIEAEMIVKPGPSVANAYVGPREQV